MGTRSGSGRFATWIVAQRRAVLGAATVLTGLLVIPMVLMVPSETASQSPTNAVTDAQDLISEQFSPAVHELIVITEAVDGNVLSSESLVALWELGQALRSDDAVGPLLVSRFVPELQSDSEGVFTIADAVDNALSVEGGPGLFGSDLSAINGAVAAILDESGPQVWGLAEAAAPDERGAWGAPALALVVEADNDALGGGSNIVSIGGDDLRKENFSRDVRAVIQADESGLRSWTVAADVNLTSIEQGTRAGPFIGLTVFVVLAVLLVAFRSYWLVAVSGLALGAVMIWLKGISNLIGLESDQLLATIVPISMISFGIDSVFHVYGRYREEAPAAGSPRRGFVVGTSAVLGAVALALASDSAAFLSNLTSPIESVQQFGVASAVAAGAAFLLLGLCTPLAVTDIEETRGNWPLTSRGTRGDLALGAGAAGLATVAVLVIVFVSAIVGAAILVLYGLVAVVWPLRRTEPYGGTDSPEQAATPAERIAPFVEAVATSVGRRPRHTLAVAGGFTAVMLFFAVQVRPSFEVTDFFAPDVDFVIGIDKITGYLGSQGGEPASILVEADLADPEALAATAGLVDELRSLDTDLLARDQQGVVVHGGAVDLVRASMNPVNSVPGMDATWLSDTDNDGLPDTRVQLETLLTAVQAGGLLDPEGRPLWTVADVATVVGKGSGEIPWATQIGVEIPDTSTQAGITAVRDLVEPRVAALNARLGEQATVTFTGSAIFRDEQLAAVIRSLLLSLPVAIILCLTLASGFMRSIRLGVLSTVPLLLVVIWLYGFMKIAGFGVNVVTATIGAISIGIGIDFATHMTMRFQEERRRHEDPEEALRAAVGGTGTALTGSALTSIAGFGILAFAPMPMFATYGLLTAIMIAFALVASVLVLPSLLLAFGPDQTPAELPPSLVAETPSRDELPSRLSEPEPASIGAFRIGLAPDLDPELTAKVMRLAIRVGTPSTFQTLTDAEIIEKVAAGSLDLGVYSILGRPDRGSDHAVLASESLWVVTAGETSPPSAEALASRPWLTGAPGSTWRLATNAAAEGLGVEPRELYVVDSIEAAARTLTGASAVAVLPERMARSLPGDRVMARRLRDLAPERTVLLALSTQALKTSTAVQFQAGLQTGGRRTAGLPPKSRVKSRTNGVRSETDLTPLVR